MAGADNIEIRSATSSHAVAMTRLAHDLGYATSAGAFSGRLATWLRSDACCALIAQDADFQPLGWIAARRGVSLLTGSHVEITALIVAESARRRGVGRRLVEAVKRWAAEHGIRSILVRSNTRRRASHKFYTELQFTKIKSQHVYTFDLTN